MILRVRDARFPDHLPGLRVEGQQPSVDGRGDDQALVDRQAPVDHAAADLRAHGGLVHFRIPAPFLMPRAGIDGEHDAPVRDPVEDAVREERRRFLPAAARPHIVGPRQPELLDVRRVDLRERAVAGFGLIQAVAEPLAALTRALQHRIVHATHLRRRRDDRQKSAEQRERDVILHCSSR